MRTIRKKRDKQKVLNPYFDNDKFDYLWRKFTQDGDKEAGELAAKMLYDLHHGICHHRCFQYYTDDFWDDMTQVSLYKIMKNGLKTYNPDKGTWYSYLCRIIFQNFFVYCKDYYKKKNRHQEYVRQTLYEHTATGRLDMESYIKRFQTYQMQKEVDELINGDYEDY